MTLTLRRRRGTLASHKLVVPTLVGAYGAVNLPATNTNGTPSWGTGASRTAGNLLVCWCAASSGSTLPGQPTGWSTAKQYQGAISSMSFFYKYAAGGDSAPVITAISGSKITSMLGEFGNVLSAGLDKTGGNHGVTQPLVTTASGIDADINELLLFGSLLTYTTSVLGTFTPTLHNASVVGTPTDNGSTNTGAHYVFGHGVTTAKGDADTYSQGFPTGNIAANGVVSAMATFKHS